MMPLLLNPGAGGWLITASGPTSRYRCFPTQVRRTTRGSGANLTILHGNGRTSITCTFFRSSAMCRKNGLSRCLSWRTWLEEGIDDGRHCRRCVDLFDRARQSAGLAGNTSRSGDDGAALVSSSAPGSERDGKPPDLREYISARMDG